MAKLHSSVLVLLAVSVGACATAVESPPSGALGDDASPGEVQSGSSGGASGGSSSGSHSSSGGVGTTSSGASSSSGSPSGSGSGGPHGSNDAGAGSGDTGTGPVMTSGDGPVIPAATGTCPTLATGTAMILGQSVQLFVGTKSEKPAPILFYWHGTGSTSGEVSGRMGAEVAEITAAGGVVASFSTTTKMGKDTGNGVWFTGDFAMADEILACVVKQLNIDTRQIFTAGCSAGGLQAGAMVFARSNYLAAAMPNSGGEVIAGSYPLEGKHVPALITTHGKMGSDVVIIDFSTTSMTEDKDVLAKGGFAVDCDHGGGHCGAPADDIAAQWKFCKDHPFGVSPEPYSAGLPSGFPTYCTITK